MEQRSRKPPPGRTAYEELPAIPAPRVPAIEAVTDDDLDGDAALAVEDKLAFEEKLAVEEKQADGLTDREKRILAFERQSWRHAGAKEQAIRDQFDLSGTRYYQLLNALLDNPAALAHDPVLVGRLRRLRGSRARARGR